MVLSIWYYSVQRRKHNTSFKQEMLQMVLGAFPCFSLISQVMLNKSNVGHQESLTFPGFSSRVPCNRKL